MLRCKLLVATVLPVSNARLHCVSVHTLRESTCLSSTMLLSAVLIPLALSTIYLVSYHVSRPTTDLKPKVFVLGLSKTGTTSVGNALALLGYKRIGWKDIRSRHLVHTFIHGDLSALVDQAHYFDAFEDLPWPYVYHEMAEMYPNAKFVLTLRKDEDTWLKSMRRHMGRGTWEPAAFFYGAQNVDGNEQIVLNYYRNHTANVRDYFKDKPDRYAELVIDDGDVNWNVLCQVAQCPEGLTPTVEFPKSNTVEHWHDGDFLANLHSLWGWTITRLEEYTSKVYYEHQWPVMNRTLELVWHYISIVELAICQLYFQFVVQTQQPLPVR